MTPPMPCQPAPIMLYVRSANRFGILKGRYSFFREEQTMAEVGKTAPEFKLKSHDGSEVSLSQFRDSKWVVISAYPLAFTGG